MFIMALKTAFGKFHRTRHTTSGRGHSEGQKLGQREQKRRLYFFSKQDIQRQSFSYDTLKSFNRSSLATTPSRYQRTCRKDRFSHPKRTTVNLGSCFPWLRRLGEARRGTLGYVVYVVCWLCRIEHVSSKCVR